MTVPSWLLFHWHCYFYNHDHFSSDPAILIALFMTQQSWQLCQCPYHLGCFFQSSCYGDCFSVSSIMASLSVTLLYEHTRLSYIQFPRDSLQIYPLMIGQMRNRADVGMSWNAVMLIPVTDTVFMAKLVKKICFEWESFFIACLRKIWSIYWLQRTDNSPTCPVWPIRYACHHS